MIKEILSNKTKYIFLLCGALLVLNGLLTTLTTSLNYGTLLACLVGATLILFGFFHTKLGFAVKLSFYILLALGVSFSAYLPIYGSIDTVHYHEDAVIVLGAGLRGETPSQSLTLRLDAACDYAQKNPQAMIVVSGGQGDNETIPESLAMKRYLVAKGVDENRILEENQSKNTKENIKFSKALLDTCFDTPYSVAVISNDFHILRAEYYANASGFDYVTHASSKTPFSIFIPATLRESAALLRAWIFGF